MGPADSPKRGDSTPYCSRWGAVVHQTVRSLEGYQMDVEEIHVLYFLKELEQEGSSF